MPLSNKENQSYYSVQIQTYLLQLMLCLKKMYFRHHNWAGIAQTFSVTGGHSYKCRIYIKLLNLGSGKSYAHVNLNIDYQQNGKYLFFNGSRQFIVYR